MSTPASAAGTRPKYERAEYRPPISGGFSKTRAKLRSAASFASSLPGSVIATKRSPCGDERPEVLEVRARLDRRPRLRSDDEDRLLEIERRDVTRSTWSGCVVSRTVSGTPPLKRPSRTSRPPASCRPSRSGRCASRRRRSRASARTRDVACASAYIRSTTSSQPSRSAISVGSSFQTRVVARPDVVEDLVLVRARCTRSMTVALEELAARTCRRAPGASRAPRAGRARRSRRATSASGATGTRPAPCRFAEQVELRQELDGEEVVGALGRAEQEDRDLRDLRLGIVLRELSGRRSSIAFVRARATASRAASSRTPDERDGTVVARRAPRATAARCGVHAKRDRDVRAPDVADDLGGRADGLVRIVRRARVEPDRDVSVERSRPRRRRRAARRRRPEVLEREVPERVLSGRRTRFDEPDEHRPRSSVS